MQASQPGNYRHIYHLSARRATPTAKLTAVRPPGHSSAITLWKYWKWHKSTRQRFRVMDKWKYQMFKVLTLKSKDNFQLISGVKLTFWRPFQHVSGMTWMCWRWPQTFAGEESFGRGAGKMYRNMTQAALSHMNLRQPAGLLFFC